jgi:hypothetical protein
MLLLLLFQHKQVGNRNYFDFAQDDSGRCIILSKWTFLFLFLKMILLSKKTIEGILFEIDKFECWVFGLQHQTNPFLIDHFLCYIGYLSTMYLGEMALSPVLSTLIGFLTITFSLVLVIWSQHLLTTWKYWTLLWTEI